MKRDAMHHQLRSEGELVAEGEFGLDREKAREKMRKFQLRDPYHYVLELVQAAHLLGARAMHFAIDANELKMRFDGALLGAEDLEDIYNAAFSNRVDAKTRALRHLAIGLNAVRALNPSEVRVDVVDETSTTRLELSDDGVEEVSRLDTAHQPVGTHVYVREKFRPGHVVEFFRRFASDLPEETILRDACRYSPRRLYLGEERISFDHQLPDGVVAKTPIETDRELGLIGIVPDADSVTVTILQNGVKVIDHRMPVTMVGARVVVESDRLTKDLSQSAFVQDEAWHEFVEQVLPVALYRSIYAWVRQMGPAETRIRRRWLLNLCDQVVPMARVLEPEAIETTQRVRGLGRSLEVLPKLIDALSNLPLWQVVEPEERWCSLEEILVDEDGEKRASIYYTRRRYEGVTLGWQRIVLLFADGPPALFDDQDDLRLIDVTDDYDDALAHRQKEARWRRHPRAEQPDPQAFPIQQRFDGPTINAFLAISKEPRSGTRIVIIKDGHEFVDKQSWAIDLNGLTLFVGGKVPANRRFDGVQPNDEYTELAFRLVGALPDFVEAHADDLPASAAHVEKFWQKLSGLLFAELLEELGLPLHATLGSMARYLEEHPDSGWATYARARSKPRRTKKAAAKRTPPSPATSPAVDEEELAGDMRFADQDQEVARLVEAAHEPIPEPQTPRERVLAELNVLLDDPSMDEARFDLDDPRLVARASAGHVHLNADHLVTRYALERPDDPIALAFLASCVHTVLDCSDDAHSAELRFHEQLVDRVRHY